ncbi:fumarate hydratase C-terminal domain-containing protein, partial [Salmonella enterica]|uniref:fumarate hydratase C-terminal domain-containing protein n=7 Tax=Salmonella enterica TaxID=28901 RepID=UPI000B25D137
MMELTLPLTKEKAKTLKVGDILFLTGFAYTCRDAAHKKIEVALSNGEKSGVLEILCHSSNIQSKRNDTCPSPSISIKRLRH